MFEGWREALTELGEQVHVFNTNDRLTVYDNLAIETGNTDREIREFRKAFTRDQVISLSMEPLLAAAMAGWPDVVMFVSGFFVDWHVPAILRARGIKVVFLCTEAPYEDPRQLELAPHADVTLLNDPATKSVYEAVCDTVAYSPHAYRPRIHHPRPDVKTSFDLVFAGTGYDSRIEFFTGMGLRGLKVALGGNWTQLPARSQLRKYLLHRQRECLDNEQTAQLYASGRAGINFYRREHGDGATNEGWAVGPREIEMAACQLFFLRDHRPEGDELFPGLPTFDDAQTAGELLRWSLKNDKLRQRGAAAAWEAIADRTFTSNAKMLLRLLDSQPVRV